MKTLKATKKCILFAGQSALGRSRDPGTRPSGTIRNFGAANRHRNVEIFIEVDFHTEGGTVIRRRAGCCDFGVTSRVTAAGPGRPTRCNFASASVQLGQNTGTETYLAAQCHWHPGPVGPP
jgi:hypothetical protein